MKNRRGLCDNISFSDLALTVSKRLINNLNNDYYNHNKGYIMSLLRFIKTDRDARKIFGKKEIVIITKQLSGVNLSQSEKNRLSRDIRKKFDFIRKVSRFEDEFDLKKGAKIKRLIEEAKKIILQDKNAKRVKEIILFGSAVDNRMTLRSDIDLAVKFDRIDLKDAALFRKSVAGKVDEKIDIQVYDVLPDKIKKEIDAKCKLIYGRIKDKREGR